MLPKLWESNEYQLGTTDNGNIFATIAFTNKVFLGVYKLISYLSTFFSVYFCLKYEYTALDMILHRKRNKLQKLIRTDIL